jgi:hypothetical protein
MGWKIRQVTQERILRGSTDSGALIADIGIFFAVDTYSFKEIVRKVIKFKD